MMRKSISSWITGCFALAFLVTASLAREPIFPRPGDLGPGSLPSPEEAEALASPSPTRVRLLTENKDAWAARWMVLDQATESIDVTYFEFHRDIFGKALLGKLLEKARQGVQIRLMLDGRGSLSSTYSLYYKSFLFELARKPNLEIKVFRPLDQSLKALPRSLRRLVASNHDKLILVDGRWVVMGGRNLAAKYYASPGDLEQPYYDTDVVFEGVELGGRVQEAFEREFDRLDTRTIEGSDFPRERLIDEIHWARVLMDRWLADGSGVDWDEPRIGIRYLVRSLGRDLAPFQSLKGHLPKFLAQASAFRLVPGELFDRMAAPRVTNTLTPELLRQIRAAKVSIDITTPYLVMTEQGLAAIADARARGVKVRILTNSPASTWNILTQSFFMTDWLDWMQAAPGLEIYMIEPDHEVHAKIYLFDQKRSIIGSYNFDPMSEKINGEVAIRLDSPEFTQQLTERFLARIQKSKACETRMTAEGVLEAVFGPEHMLEGSKGKWIRFLSRWPFLRSLV